MLRLRVSPSVLSLEGPEGQTESTRAVLALTVDRSRVGICSVGETDDEIVTRLDRELDSLGPGRGLVARRLLAAAERRAPAEAPSGPKIRLVRPGDDPWWDQRIHDPYALRSGEHRRSFDPREVLVVHPLEPDTWSPHLFRGLLVYVFWSSAWTRHRTFFTFLRPKVELRLDASITGLQRVEAIDTVRGLWGPSRVVLPEGETVPLPPRTRLKIAHAVTRILFWVAAIVMLVSAHPEPGPTAVIAGVIAAAALFTSRVLGARLEAERPRRLHGGTPEQAS